MSRFLVCLVSLGLLVCAAWATVRFTNAEDKSKASQTKPQPSNVDPNGDYKDELPRIAPREPDDSLKQLEVLPGYRVDLVASEPLLTDPISVSFDERGRMFLVCMRGYSEDPGDLLGEIRMLEDADGDGRFDRSSVYVDGLSWPTAVICYDGGVFVAAAPDILYCKDTDGDGAADVRRRVFTGFGRSNVQGLVNSFRWGLDNRIHGATSSSGASVVRVGEENATPVELRGRDFAFNPRTLEIEPTSGGAQHGLSFDDWGCKFVCSNSSHIQLVMFEDRYLRRNKYLAAPSARKMIAVDGGQAEVYRLSPVEPWRIVRTRLRVAKAVPGPVEGGGRAAGYFTGSTGVTIYRGNACPQLRGLAFVGDVGSNIVHRKRLVPESIGFRAERIDQETEFLRSREIWFRPVQMANAPDGGLYVLDMYREVIEHPKSLPPVIKKHLDLTSGRDRGRVYRVVPEGFRQPPPPRLHEATTDDLVATLAHENAWHREAAARLLFERQDRAAAGPLRKLVHDCPFPQGRMHALYALAGLDALEPADALAALADQHPRVREHAVRLSEGLAGGTAGTRAEAAPLRAALARLAETEPDLRVRYQLAFTLGELAGPARNQALAAIARRDAGDSWIRLAVLSSLATGAGDVFATLAADSEFRATGPGAQMLAALAQQIGARNRREDVARLVGALDRLKDDAQLASAVVGALSRGLGKNGAELREQLGSGGAEAGRILAQMILSARDTALDEKRPPEARADAVRTLALGEFSLENGVLAKLLDSRQPREVQLAALAAAGRFDEAGVGPLVLEGWGSYSPSVRAAATETLMARPQRIAALLNAVASGDVRPTDLEPARIKFLREHPSEAIRARASELLAEVKLRRRQEVVEAYQPALKAEGDIARGKAVFKKICANCHKAEGAGHEIGPNLAAMKNRGAETILLNVLDPNREVNPQFLNYVLQTSDGRSLTGMIAAETANSVTLRRAENQTDTVLRVDIEALQSTGLSIMPEGMEKEISPQAMADLIAYVLSLK